MASHLKKIDISVICNNQIITNTIRTVCSLNIWRIQRDDFYQGNIIAVIIVSVQRSDVVAVCHLIWHNEKIFSISGVAQSMRSIRINLSVMLKQYNERIELILRYFKNRSYSTYILWVTMGEVSQDCLLFNAKVLIQ
eukprot:36612_1